MPIAAAAKRATSSRLKIFTGKLQLVNESLEDTQPDSGAYVSDTSNRLSSWFYQDLTWLGL